MRDARKIAIGLAAALTALAAGCATGPHPSPSQIDFVWGCWVQKEEPGGTIQAFLRLLPDQEKSRYAGSLTQIPHRGAEVSLSFARDGDTATLGYLLGGPDENGGFKAQAQDFLRRDLTRGPRSGADQHLAAFRSVHTNKLLIAEGTSDRLKIAWESTGRKPEPEDLIFDGERDGCD